MRAVLLLAGAVVASGAVGWLARSYGLGAHGSGAAQVVACGPKSAESLYPGMVFVPAGSFSMGSDDAFPEEGPVSQQSLIGFWMDRTEVTNAQFAEFVAATGYRTLAERGVRVAPDPASPVVAGSAVFRPQGEGTRVPGLESWWTFVPGANWREPEGPGSSLEGRAQQPVVHVAFEDAAAYAAWAGRSLPTEEQFELAAQTSARRNSSGEYAANTWQGRFPVQNDPIDGYAGPAPVACYEPNTLGLYDMIGNVWEWTASAYYPRHDFAARSQHPDGYDPNQRGEPVAVLKGGSYLCAPDYCMRYRPQARIGQSR
ncbi:MAG TPA: SUMF1/EgtB/PvdO family nonheme iron enzyme, partial [Gammaproteobacteria bacterium]|nr:SUMF1/EgtB/PvdO family nonheme iron enzyme [Gammaproteobacteria bacterium]